MLTWMMLGWPLLGRLFRTGLVSDAEREIVYAAFDGKRP